MGITQSKKQPYEVPGEECYINRLPLHVCLLVFDNVSAKEIICNCRRVCKAWRESLDDPYFWQSRMMRAGKCDKHLMSLESINWPLLYMNTIYEPNLLRVVEKKKLMDPKTWLVRPGRMGWPSFKSGEYLKIETASSLGRGNWIVETCIGNTDFQLIEENGGSRENYASSYMWCLKEKIIDLGKCGFTRESLDCLQPSITVSEWFAARDDCGSVYNLYVALLDCKYKVIDYFEHTTTTLQWQDGKLGWRRVEHVFTKYGKGVHYVRFAHGGKDTQFWAGHYGSKMAGSQVRIQFST